MKIHFRKVLSPASLSRLLLALTLPLASCAQVPLHGNGRIETETRRPGSFASIEMSGAGTLRVERGPAFKVELSMDSNLLARYASSVSGGVLRLGFERGLAVTGPSSLEVRVTMPELEGLSLSGAVQAELLDAFEGDSLELVLSGAGRIRGRVDYDELSARISGAGAALLEGRAERAEFRISGTGSIEAERLEIETARVAVSGAGDARLRVSEALEAEISGTGSIGYRGDPRVERKVSGVGRIFRAGD